MRETIFALATPPGQSAIAIFRLSGDRVASLAEKLSGKIHHHRQLTPSLLKDETGAPLDDAMMVYLQSPHSPTGEDVLEIHCHGSLSVIDALSRYLAHQEGVRAAQPGEFTKRAFDNGKMDLTEVEGLADLIAAQTDSQRRQALGQLKGQMRRQATAWRQDIISLSGRLESLIDFSDEELPDSVLTDIGAKRDSLIQMLSDVLDDDSRGEIIRNGLQVVLLGPVNAGKSTALNALAGRPAAIVSDEAGTTRDIVEVRLDIDGVAVILQDTAGVRDEAGTVESIGIARAKQAAQEADLVIIMADGSQSNWQEDALGLAQSVTGAALYIVNKADRLVGSADETRFTPLSLQNESDVEILEDMVAEAIRPLNHEGSASLITRQRHRALIGKALAALRSSSDMSIEDSPELVAEDLRVAADALGQMTGHIDVEDILGDIFSSFCIGK